jgi:hypothetical protein
MAPTLLSSLPPRGALCSGPAEPDPRKRLDLGGRFAAPVGVSALDGVVLREAT